MRLLGLGGAQGTFSPGGGEGRGPSGGRRARATEFQTHTGTCSLAATRASRRRRCETPGGNPARDPVTARQAPPSALEVPRPRGTWAGTRSKPYQMAKTWFTSEFQNAKLKPKATGRSVLFPTQGFTAWGFLTSPSFPGLVLNVGGTECVPSKPTC